MVLLIVIFSGLIVALIAVLIVVVRLCRPVDLYQEGMAGYWKTAPVSRSYVCQTLGGFKCRYRVDAVLRRVDDEDFRTHRMLKDENRALPLQTFHTERVQAALYPLSLWAYRYCFTRGGGPWISMFRVEKIAGGWVEHFDPNGDELVDFINDATQGKHPSGRSYCGCTITISLMKPEIDRDLIEENFRMITPDVHAKAEQYLELQKVKEAAVIKALKFQYDLAQRTTKHRGQHYTVSATVCGTAVTIAWTLNDNAAGGKGGYRLKGFRTVGGFAATSPLSDGACSERCVVDNTMSGSCVDRPNPGTTHYYSFYLDPDTKDYRRHDLVRFEVHVPDEDTVTRLQALLQDVRSGTPEPRESNEHRAILEKVRFAARRTDALLTLQKTLIAEINARTDLDADEKNLHINAVKAEIEVALYN